MATVWKGAINFGLVNVPVKLYTATDKKAIAFRSLHKKCKTPINQKRWCNECDEEVPYAGLIKGFELEKGEFIEVTDSDLKSLPLKSTKYIQITEFIKLGEIDPVYFEKSYFLAPEAAGEKPYVLLSEAMNKTDTVALASITLREKEHLCLVRVYEGALMLSTMFYPSEIKQNSETDMAKISKKADISEAETALAIQIIDNLTGKFEPDKYVNHYQEEFMKMVTAKAEGREPEKPDAKTRVEGKALDLFEKLKASVEATRAEQNKTPAKKSTKKTAKGGKKNDVIIPKDSDGTYAGR